MPLGALDPLTRDRTTKVDLAFQKSENLEAPLWVEPLVQDFTSTGSGNLYPKSWVAGRMREWFGERIYRSLIDGSFRVKNRKFEYSARADVDEIEDDEFNGYDLLGDGLALAARMWKQDLVVELLLFGETKIGVDDQYFFDTDHPFQGGKSVYSNLFTGKPLVSAGVPQYANFESVMLSMALNTDGDKRPVAFNSSDIYLVVPKQLEGAARAIVEKGTLANGETNMQLGKAKVLVGPDLGVSGLADAATSWYIADAGGIKPLAFQMRTDPTKGIVKVLDGVFEMNEIRWGTKGRGAAFGGVPWKMAKAKA